MRIAASDEARKLIAAGGGRLYVSVKAPRCCGAVKTLVAKTQVDGPEDFRLVAEDAGLELFLPHRLVRLPEELHLEARRFPRRIEAYWNGCAWVV